MSLLARTNELLLYIVGAKNNTTNLSSFTSSVYTSAWVAMVRKQNQPDGPLAFPECFQYVLDQQDTHGGWQTGALDFDNIMDTMAGLLALTMNKDIALCSMSIQKFELRVSNAILRLDQHLGDWDIVSCDFVGFEVLMPTMLELLESKGFPFEFPSLPQLLKIREAKIAILNKSAWWSGDSQTSITHSLEGFVGKIDFSELGKQKIDGSLGNSPSSTAAYLMYSREWDVDAEDHLKRLLKKQESSEPGGLPVSYPTTGFETLWIASTLLQNGIEILDTQHAQAIGDIVEEYYQYSDGLASGFSKYGIPDADDTSKSIILRNLLAHPTFPDRLIERFGGSECIRTYDLERTPSVATNCHALLAILSCPEPGNYRDDIEKVVSFLCSTWMRPDIPFTDKWNNSEFYPMMLLSEALVEFLYNVDQCTLGSQSNSSSCDQLCLVSIQILNKILLCRNHDGSWGPNSSREITAYAIIALANLMSLPLFPEALRTEIAAAIEHGRSYLTSSAKSPKVEKIWIDKISFSPVNVSKAYIIAAEKVPYPKRSFGHYLRQTLLLPKEKLERLVSLYISFQHLNQYPLWAIQGSVLESHFHTQKLLKFGRDVFSREGKKADKYITVIALNLTCANNLQKLFIKNDSLFELMLFVLRIYQIDDFAENTIAKTSDHTVNGVKGIIEQIFMELEVEIERNTLVASGYNDVSISPVTELPENSVVPNRDYHTTLKALVDSILSNRHIQSSSRYDSTILRGELQECLQAHIQQIIDSRENHKNREADKFWLPPVKTFHSWLRTAGSAHSCSLVMLAFQRCLLKRPAGRKSKDSPEKLYLIQDLWMHLSNKGRLENDRASLQRDRKEQNLNSLDFEEFRHFTDEEALEQITRLIDYEKRCCKYAFDELEQLEKENGAAKSDVLLDSRILRFQCFFGDLYNDLYDHIERWKRCESEIGNSSPEDSEVGG